MARQSTDAGVAVLLTRPQEASERFAADLIARYAARVRPVIAPLLEIRPVVPTLPDQPFSGVVFTSVHGVLSSLALRERLPKLAFCVGARTAEAARGAGFQPRSADGDASALVTMILAQPPGGAVLHLHGEETRGDVVERLRAAGQEAEGLVTYRQVPRPLAAEARELLGAPSVLIVPLFSPRTARLFAAEVAGPPVADCRLVAMSRVVAEASGRPAIIAKRPDADAMLDAVGTVLGAVSSP